MSLDNLIRRDITGVRPFNELPIDALVWGAAHEHHHAHRKLHALGAHRPGIVYGLEVIPQGERGIVIAPGVAVDALGETVILSAPRAMNFSERGQNHVILMFRAVPDPDSLVRFSGGQDYSRLIEAREILITRDLPAEPFIELARVYRSGADKKIGETRSAFDPASDELNFLHRPLAFPHCYADMAVGEVGYVPASDKSSNAWKPNRAGLYNLIREGNGQGFKLDFLGAVPLDGDLPVGMRAPTLLYMAGKDAFMPLAEKEVAGLTRFLENGGTLLGEATQPGAAFAKAFGELAGKLGAKLRPVDAGHSVLSAHFLFPSVPPGATEGGELSADTDAGVYFSTSNYGGAWQGDVSPGGKGEATTALRERVRQAQEFGLNLVAAAARRGRLRQLQRMTS